MTLESQYKQFLKDNPDTTFSFKEWMSWHSHQMEQAIIKMMQDDEELGLYDYDWCKGNVVLPREEIKLEDVFNDEKREGIKKFIDEVKSIPKELNPYIGPFLLNNGFEKKENNNYHNSECTIIVNKDYYEVQFIEPDLGGVSMYTDSLSVYHLVGILTWFNLIDKNYKK